MQSLQSSRIGIEILFGKTKEKKIYFARERERVYSQLLGGVRKGCGPLLASLLR